MLIAPTALWAPFSPVPVPSVTSQRIDQAVCGGNGGQAIPFGITEHLSILRFGPWPSCGARGSCLGWLQLLRSG